MIERMENKGPREGSRGRSGKENAERKKDLNKKKTNRRVELQTMKNGKKYRVTVGIGGRVKVRKGNSRRGGARAKIKADVLKT